VTEQRGPRNGVHAVCVDEFVPLLFSGKTALGYGWGEFHLSLGQTRNGCPDQYAQNKPDNPAGPPTNPAEVASEDQFKRDHRSTRKLAGTRSPKSSYGRNGSRHCNGDSGGLFSRRSRQSRGFKGRSRRMTGPDSFLRSPVSVEEGE